MITANELRTISLQTNKGRYFNRNKKILEDISEKLINYASSIGEYTMTYVFDNYMLIGDIEFIYHYLKDKGFSVDIDISNRDHSKLIISWK